MYNTNPLFKTGSELKRHRQHWKQVKNNDKHNIENYKKDE